VDYSTGGSVVTDETLAEAQAEDAGLPQEPAAEEEVAQANDTLEGVPADLRTYVQSSWKGLPNYQCPYCKGFRTVDPVTIRLHIDKTHAVSWLEGV
jgi:hypothetical protein